MDYRVTILQKATKHTLNDLLHYVPSVVVPFVFGILSVAVFTRLMSPAEYGLFNIIMATSLFVEIIAYHWLNQSILRYYERNKTDGIQAFFTTSIFGFFAIAAITTLIMAAVLSVPLDGRMAALFTFLPLLIFCQAGYKFVLIFLRAMQNSGRYSILTSINAVSRLALALGVLFYIGPKAEALLLGTAMAAALVFLTETLRLATRWRPSAGLFDRQLLAQFARFGMPLVALAVVNLVLSVSDRYLIEFMSGTADVGIYSAGYKIAETAVFGLVLFLTLASFPALIKTYENEGSESAVKLMRDHLSLFVLLMVPAVFGISALAREIIALTLGRAYQGANELLPWISAGIFFMGLSLYYGKSFELKERTGLIPILYSGPALLNIILNLVLIPSFGLPGAAFATFAAYFVCCILMMVFGNRYLRWRFPWSTALKAICASILMTIVINSIPEFGWGWLFLLGKITLGFTVYLGCILLVEKRMLDFTRSLLKTKLLPVNASNE